MWGGACILGAATLPIARERIFSAQQYLAFSFVYAYVEIGWTCVGSSVKMWSGRVFSVESK